jgi:hypothetical protein
MERQTWPKLDQERAATMARKIPPDSVNRSKPIERSGELLFSNGGFNPAQCRLVSRAS